MKVVKRLELVLYILLFHLYSFAVFAASGSGEVLPGEEEFADDPGLPLEGDPGTQAPIDTWVYLGLGLGILLMYYYWKRQSQEKI
jgi:hypothetical protein